jgi:hypothetical protein
MEVRKLEKNYDLKVEKRARDVDITKKDVVTKTKDIH